MAVMSLISPNQLRSFRAIKKSEQHDWELSFSESANQQSASKPIDAAAPIPLLLPCYPAQNTLGMNLSLASSVPRSGGLVQERESTKEEDARAFPGSLEARFDRQQDWNEGIAAAAVTTAETATIRPSQAFARRVGKNARHNEGKR